MNLLYLTDREPIERKDGSIKYGYGRSWSLAHGQVEVEIGKDATWEELVAASRTDKRKGSWPLKVTSIAELGRFPKSPLPLIERDGGKVTGSVSGRTDYLLVGETPGGTKYNRARELGLTMIGEGELLGMIESGNARD